MKKRVVLVTPYFPPDQGPIPMMYGVLCNHLVDCEFDVHVLTAEPHYGDLVQKSSFNRLLYSIKDDDGLKIVRFRVPKFRKTNRLGRLATLIVYNFLCGIYLLFAAKKDVALVVNPAMEIFLPLLVLRYIKNVKIHYRVHDVYPDIGIRLGIFRNSLVIRILSIMENVCYRSATTISVVNHGFVNLIEGKGVAKQKMEVIRDWVDTDMIYPMSKTNDFSSRYGYQNKFIIMYGGNLGYSQGLEMLVNAANVLKGRKEILFLFVGKGVMKETLELMVNELRLENVEFHPYQPEESLNQVYASADVGFVSLLPKVSPEWCPAKIYTIMASGRPIIAAVDPGGDAETFISDSGAGVCVEFGDVSSLVDAINDLVNNAVSRDEMGIRGRISVIRHASRAGCVKQLTKSISKLCI